MKMKAEIGATNTKDCQTTTEARKRQRTGSPSQLSEGPSTQFQGGGLEGFLEEMMELNFKN